MTRTQAINIIKRIRAAFALGNMDFDIEQTREEYIKSMIGLDNEIVDIAIDDLKETNKFTPTIAELLEQYNYLLNMRKKQARAGIPGMCPVCRNYGFVEVEEDHQGVPYKFIYHCTRCEHGNDFKYDGRNNKRDPNNYIIFPIDNVLDVDELISRQIVGTAENEKEAIMAAVNRFTGQSHQRTWYKE